MSIKSVLNTGRVPQKFIDDPDFKSPMKTLRLGAAAGSRRLYVNIDHVKPGAKSVKYHSHSKQEEFFLILQGNGTLRINGKKIGVKKGDFLAKPAGQGIAHQFINTGSEVLQILDCGTEDSEDVVVYPDEDAVLIRSLKRVFRGRQSLRKWSSDPNGS